jgi:tetratricopeptide (TPR) repeat protein
MHEPLSTAQQLAYRLALAMVLGLAVSLPPAPPPTGAVRPLWTIASDLKSLNSYAAAVEVYEQIARLAPGAPEPLLAIGDIYLAQRRWPVAEDAFNRALVRDGENARALAGLATLRWHQADRLRAVSLWETAIAALQASNQRDRSPTELTAARMQLSLAYLDMGRFAEAETTLRQELADYGTPAARLYLAMLQAGHNTDEARRELAAIEDTSAPQIRETRDYLLAALDHVEAADSPAQAAKSLGLAYVQIEEWQLARAALEDALALDPGDAETMAFLGHSEAQVGRPAFAHLSGAAAARPDWPAGHYLLGLYYLKQGAYDFAAEEFRVTLRLDPGNAQAGVDLARACTALGQYLAAEEALVGAVAAAPKDLAFHLALVRFYANHGLAVSSRGLAAAQAAADLAPDDAQAREMLGWMYFLAGDPRLARLHLESALQLAPDAASVHYHLGVLRRALGDTEAARFAFYRAIDLDKEGFFREQAQTALREMKQPT